MSDATGTHAGTALPPSRRLDEVSHGERAGGAEQEGWHGPEGSGSGDEGMVTPPSHFSDSLQSTPLAGDAEAAAAYMDALAPREVVGRVLSDVGAEVLHDELAREQQRLLVGRSPQVAEVMGLPSGRAPGGEAGEEGSVAGAYDAGGGSSAAVRPARQASPPSSSAGQSGGSYASPHGVHQESSELLDTPSTEATFSFQPNPSGQHPQATPGIFTASTPAAGGGSTAAPHSRGAHADPHPHTGIRLSVARRLSEQAERRRVAGTPGTEIPSSVGTQQTVPSAVHGHHRTSTVPVMEFEDVPELEAFAEHGGSSAVLNVLTAPYYAPAAESSHSA